jgi:hypothetical protein
MSPALSPAIEDGSLLRCCFDGTGFTKARLKARPSANALYYVSKREAIKPSANWPKL